MEVYLQTAEEFGIMFPYLLLEHLPQSYSNVLVIFSCILVFMMRNKLFSSNQVKYMTFVYLSIYTMLAFSMFILFHFSD